MCSAREIALIEGAAAFEPANFRTGADKESTMSATYVWYKLYFA
jgi:hypothetical protein